MLEAIAFVLELACFVLTSTGERPNRPSTVFWIRGSVVLYRARTWHARCAGRATSVPMHFACTHTIVPTVRIPAYHTLVLLLSVNWNHRHCTHVWFQLAVCCGIPYFGRYEFSGNIDISRWKPCSHSVTRQCLVIRNQLAAQLRPLSEDGIVNPKPALKEIFLFGRGI